MNEIHFFKEGIRFSILHREQLTKWVANAVRQNKFQIREINFIFCSDAYLLSLNKTFLNHNFLTDIITFDNSSEKRKISADIFISYPRVKVNAKKFHVPLKDELHRVMIHGVLHLLGHKDKTKKDRARMRKMEDELLGKRNF